jgi:hypothetical protein
MMLLLPCRNAWQSGEGIKKYEFSSKKPHRNQPIKPSAWGSKTPSNKKSGCNTPSHLFPHPILLQLTKEEKSFLDS